MQLDNMHEFVLKPHKIACLQIQKGTRENHATSSVQGTDVDACENNISGVQQFAIESYRSVVSLKNYKNAKYLYMLCNIKIVS